MQYQDHQPDRPIYKLTVAGIGMLLLLLLGLGLFLAKAEGWRTSGRATASGDFGHAATTFSGHAMHRDNNNGTPSLASDRLVIDLNGVTSAGSGSFYAYLLAGSTAAGAVCGPLPVTSNLLQSNCDFPGRNLIAAYDTFQLLQESMVFTATLPPQTLGHLRKVIVQSDVTPNKVGYAVGLVQQAQILFEHAGYAQGAAGADNVVEVKQHVEHILNILYGASDARYGDQDGDGVTSNPGDGYGVLSYARQLSQTLQLAANSGDATDNIISRVAQVQTALGNLGTGADGRWLALLIENANLALKAPTANDAATFTNRMVGLANRILNGEELNDNGEIEPIQGEGGARTAHRYAQFAAEQISFANYVRYGSSSALLINDQLIINLPNVAPPLGNEKLWIYLLLDNGERAPIGAATTSGSAINTTFTLPGRDLLAQSGAIYLTKGVKYAEAALPLTALQPIRQVLHQASETPNQVGYAVGLVQQTQLLFEHANYMKDAFSAGKLAEAKQHTEHTLNILYGAKDPRYGDADQDGVASNPGDGYGVLVYTQKVSATLQLAGDSPDATANIKTRVAQVRTTLSNLGNGADAGWSALLIEDANLALKAPSPADGLPYANQGVGVANRILNGEELNDNGQIEPIQGEGGAQTAYLYSQQAADYYPQALVTPPTSTATPTPTTNQPGVTTTPMPTPTGATPVPSGGDVYEVDDQCTDAKNIADDGLFQNRSFQKQADNDWVRFSTVAGVTYVIEARVPPNSRADVVVELHANCESAATTTQGYSFSPDIRLRFEAPATGAYYLRLQNQKPDVFGDQITYQLSVSAFQSTAPQVGALIVVAGRNAEGDVLQGRIHNVTNRVYQLWRSNGYAADRIRYLATDLSLDADLDGQADVAALPNKANLQNAIINWASTRVSAVQALSIYIMDHGAYDKIYLDEPRGERLSPQDLNSWLSQLEAAVPGVKINIIIEACNSGSFIDPDNSISKPGRVVITSAGAFSLAWASADGAAFSDVLLDSLVTGQSLYLAFDEARTNVRRKHNDQVAWLDDDGDGLPNDGQDGAAAAARGFNNPGSFDPSSSGQWKPYVVTAEVRTAATHTHSGAPATAAARGEIWAEVRDNSTVRTVLATIYPPSYQAPTASEELVLAPPPITLQARGNNLYAGLYGAFDEIGSYRIVVSAIDDDNLESRVLEFSFNTGSVLFMPLVAR